MEELLIKLAAKVLVALLLVVIVAVFGVCTILIFGESEDGNFTMRLLMIKLAAIGVAFGFYKLLAYLNSKLTERIEAYKKEVEEEEENQ